MYEEPADEIRKHFESKATEELLQIWHSDDRDFYSDKAFEVVHGILAERGHALLPKKPSAEIRREAIEKAKAVRQFPAGPVGDQYVCTHCWAAFDCRQSSKRHSFLGFVRLRCPECHQRIIYPWTKYYRISNICGLVIVVILCVLALLYGLVIWPGVIPIVFAWALSRDFALRHQVQNAWWNNKHKPKPMGSNASVHKGTPVGDNPHIPARADRLRWDHVAVALFMPFLGVPWGLVNVLRGKRRSGCFLIVTSMLMVLLVLGLSHSSQR